VNLSVLSVDDSEKSAQLNIAVFMLRNVTFIHCTLHSTTLSTNYSLLIFNEYSIS